MENGETATVDTPDLVKSILDTANPDVNNRYYKNVTDEGVVTPNNYIVPISELYTNGTGAGGGTGTGDVEAGDVLESERPEDWTSDKVTPIADGEGGGGVIPLPDGFTYVGGTKSEGIVISDDPADERKGTSWEVAQTLKGNQFVWVPVENDADFQRYDGYRNGQNQSDYMEENMSISNYFDNCAEPYSGGYTDEETEYNQMKASVLMYNGFYVGRYEAGVEGERTSGINDEVVIKQGKNVYNNIGWSSSNDMKNEKGGAVEVAKSMYSKEERDSETSTLIYGVQWDAIMSWIDPAYKTGSCAEDSFVRDSTGKGYYEQSSVTVTGSSESYAVKNIYDLAGNCWEWTMESCYTKNRVFRGRQLHQYRS